jgi:hypothetical protein
MLSFTYKLDADISLQDGDGMKGNSALKERTVGDDTAAYDWLLPSRHKSSKREPTSRDTSHGQEKEKPTTPEKRMNWQCTMSVVSCIDASGPVLFVD